jgi:hypothetical protein
VGQKSVATSATPTVAIESVMGSLQVKGWDRDEVLLRTESEALGALEGSGDRVRITCQGDCVVRLPHAAVIQASRVHGNARFKLLEGELSLDQVLGSLELRNVAAARVGSVHGNLLAKQVSGDLHVEQVLGSAIIRDVQGECRLGRVAGNLDLHDTEGEIEASAGGNARLGLCLLTGQTYAVRAAGSLQCQVPEDASLRVELSSVARRIQVSLPDGKTTLAEDRYRLSLGAGDASLRLESGGPLTFTCQPGDWADMNDFQEELDDAFTEFAEELGQQLSDQVDLQIETQMDVLNEQLAKLETLLGQSGMPAAEAEQTMRRAKEASERATQRAQERMLRAQVRLDRKLEAAQRKAELKMRAAERRAQPPDKPGVKFQWPAPPAPPGASEGVSEEERLLILKMLEQKKISIAEAEQLLAALEGKGS